MNASTWRMYCMPFQNPGLDEIRELLRKTRTIAVVGLSPKAGRPSHQVSEAMQGYGYRIIPVRPATDEVLGEHCYPALYDIPEPGQIDLVDVFRAPEHVDEIVDACIALKLPAIWLQDGVVNEAAALRAVQAGITVVMDRCVYRDYHSLKVGTA
jgi:predicted CoA-binding protein